jgi:PAS domain S-box-containing protein
MSVLKSLRKPEKQDLAQRLSEAEATIAALLAGQIDAVVDSKSNSPVLLARAQNALRESESNVRHERDRAQRYLDTAEVILLALDTEGRITLANRYACSILGWTADELHERDWFGTCVPARLRDGVRTTFNNLLAGDLSIIENAILTKSGEERLIEWRNTLKRDEAGYVIGTFSSGTDITQRHEAIEALRTAEERMRFALQSANVGIWDMDYTTGAHAWSETLEAQYGLKPGSFEGTFEAFVALLHPDDRASVLETVGKAMTTGSDFSVQNRTIWRDGTVRWLNGAGRIYLGEDGNPLRAIGISLDITDRRKLEDQYQQAQKMEAVGRLAGGVAHDFNNLLMVITGYSDLLLQGLMIGDSRRDDLEQIRKAADAAASLTRQLLAFSRQQVIKPSLVVLEEVVEASTKMLQRLIGEDVDLVTRLNDTMATVLIDPGQLEQVIMNLAVNARDAMPTGGKLTIETSTVELTAQDARAFGNPTTGRFAMLAASDTGVGMDEQTRARIFEPFFTTKDQGKGTGLGLATVYGIVNQSGGFIWVYSEPGKGATFKIYLPLVENASATAQVSKGDEITPRGSETILLVEDSDGVRDIARRVLEQQGYHVIEAPSPTTALDTARDFKGVIDLLLTDVVMPGMSGRILAEKFAQDHPRAKLLFMSGYTDDAVVRHGVLSEKTPYLQKPFSPHALAQRVRDVLDAA